MLHNMSLFDFECAYWRAHVMPQTQDKPCTWYVMYVA